MKHHCPSITPGKTTPTTIHVLPTPRINYSTFRLPQKVIGIDCIQELLRNLRRQEATVKDELEVLDRQAHEAFVNYTEATSFILRLGPTKAPTHDILIAKRMATEARDTADMAKRDKTSELAEIRRQIKDLEEQSWNNMRSV